MGDVQYFCNCVIWYFVVTYNIKAYSISTNPVTTMTNKTMLTSPTAFIDLVANGVITTADTIPIEFPIPTKI